MDPLMQLVVGWTLVGGFVFTVVVTLLSLVGVVKFADPRQQRALFGALVLELIVGVGGQAVGAWRFDARAVAADVHAEGALDGGSCFVHGHSLRYAPMGRRSRSAATLYNHPGTPTRGRTSVEP